MLFQKAVESGRIYVRSMGGVTMKLFLSWSGELSKALAVELRDWVPSVIQAVKPYVSSEDISKGARWSHDIAKELEATSFGILCVTKDNVDAPWIHFEAGALSKEVGKARVCPLLLNLRLAELPGDSPLLQFQTAACSQDEIRKLLASINDCVGEQKLTDERLKKYFEKFWPDLQAKLESLKQVETRAVAKKEPASLEQIVGMLEELQTLARNQQRRPSYEDFPMLPSLSTMLQGTSEDLRLFQDYIRHRDDQLALKLMKKLGSKASIERLSEVEVSGDTGDQGASEQKNKMGNTGPIGQ